MEKIKLLYKRYVREGKLLQANITLNILIENKLFKKFDCTSKIQREVKNDMAKLGFKHKSSHHGHYESYGVIFFY